MTSPFALIIEKDHVLGGIVEKTLEDAGFDAVVDIGGIQYVSILVTRHPALVVLDLDLPEGLGEQVLADLRNLYPAWALPVVLVTSDSFQAWDLRAQDETVLIKPVIPAQLIDIILRIKNTLEGSL